MNKDLHNRCYRILIDFLACFFSLFLSLFIISLFGGNILLYLPKNQFVEYIILHLFISFSVIIWFWLQLRHYTYRKPFWFELRETLKTILIFAIFELALIAFSKFYVSRYLWVITWICVLFLIPVARVMVYHLLLKKGLLFRDTVIIGAKQNALDAFMALQSEPYLGFKISSFVGDSSELIESVNVPIAKASKNLLQQFDPEKTQFIIALEQSEFEERYEWLRYFSKHGCRMVSVVPSIRGVPLYGTDFAFLFSYDVMLLRINNNLARLSSQLIKRVIDFLGALSIILVISPILLIIFLLVAKDGGSPVYSQARIGKNGKVFRCYKFRSMKKNAEKLLKQLLNNDEELRIEWEQDHKLKNDPRVTKLGAFLRRSSLDELPQLFNVLRGDMSLVGPRPIVREEMKRYENDLDYYLIVRPGMTGLWQVSGRNNVDYETRIYFDSWYVKNWSVWTDIIILCKTFSVVLKRAGAY